MAKRKTRLLLCQFSAEIEINKFVIEKGDREESLALMCGKTAICKAENGDYIKEK